MFQMLGVFAEFERAIIRERVVAGMARAKANGTKSGKPIGRPAIHPARRAAIRAAYKLARSACEPFARTVRCWGRDRSPMRRLRPQPTHPDVR
jgi:DNA invertase Pin-like site-specific DNA recombinase